MKTKNETIYLIIRIVSVVLILVYIVSMFRGTKESTASFSSVKENVIGAADLSNLQEGEGRMIKRLYGLNTGDYEDICLFYPTTNMGVEEIFLIKIKNEAERDEVINAINSRLEKQKKSFDGYGVDQTKLLNESIIDDKGNYLLFVVGENAEAIDSAFINSL